VAGEIRRCNWREKRDSGMGRLSGKPRADHEGGPGGIFIKERAEGFEEKGEVLLIGVPAADGDDLILFLNGRIELKDIGLNGVRNTVDFFWIGTKAGGERFPKDGGSGSFDKNGGQEFQSFL